MRVSQIRFINQLGFPGSQFPDSFYTALMFQPRAIGVVVLLGVWLQSAWPFASLATVLWLSTWLPSLNPFDAVYNQAIAYPRGLRELSAPPAPRRFAQGLAGSVAMVIAIALFLDARLVAWLFQGLFIVALLAVVFRDNCAGAEVYLRLKRRTPATAVIRTPHAGSNPRMRL